MIYKAYRKHIVTGNPELIEVRKVSNKIEMREQILSSKRLQEIFLVKYGRKEYSMSDIYAGR